MIDREIVDLVLQAGAFGLCVVLLYLGYKKDIMFNETLNNHFEHDTEAKNNLASALSELKEFLHLKYK